MLLACLLLPTVVSALLLPTSGDANAWFHTGGASVRQLCAIPFSMADVLLPGETLQIHLVEPHQLAVFMTMTQRDHGCVGMLLHNTEGGVCKAAPLLELRETRRCDADGFWCNFCCMGAVQIHTVELRATGQDGYLEATVTVVRELRMTVDFESADDEEAFLADAVERAHGEVCALRRLQFELVGATDDRAPPPVADEYARLGYRLGPVIGPYCDMGELLVLRAEELRARGVDAAPLANLGHLHALWGTVDEESARRRAP